MSEQTTPPPDTLNDVGVLKRREFEARMVAPLIQRLGEEVGHARMTELAREVVVGVAQEQGGEMAEALGGNDLNVFAGSMENWTKGGALEIDIVEKAEGVFAFNVTRCQYAEMYRALGIPELGALFSCDRDGTMVEGFNADINFERNQTIMSGAGHCDFRYTLDAGDTPVEISKQA
ncbi:MAG: L-2-amino-thiazoline-4-carboxylic acid hydrolase [Actinomycetota bacterium]|nr:L-2-amino-thiazoline-4-carboxylic acid hydrolase [Actinomycetota bacterium]